MGGEIVRRDALDREGIRTEFPLEEVRDQAIQIHTGGRRTVNDDRPLAGVQEISGMQSGLGGAVDGFRRHDGNRDRGFRLFGGDLLGIPIAEASVALEIS